ncbi:site-specific integrase [Levilactobacillus bambusae]|uniref:Recombinase XerD n=1 Tax=Levilactobacillus bambusae TaxID=2024736 RepID=A0A2V1N4A7_9LACO|nr:site-specific integrase [Levilactobacillus bambusae]PWG00806.1 recombinase XerD [Levilactobacillus bambusae]
MTTHYPYQDSFEAELMRRGRKEITIRDYSATLADLFHYLSEFNTGYQSDHRVATLLDRDLEDYLMMLQTKRHIENSTYNRIRSQLTTYFKFLFLNGKTPHLPTLTLAHQPLETNLAATITWLYQLDALLRDDQLAWYTRLTLLLSSQGFTSDEFLTPGFAATHQNDPWMKVNQPFFNQFNQFLAPIQVKQQSDDWFLKQRFSADPHLTLPGLHKYLKSDEAYVGFSLAPSKLYRSYVLNFLRTHRTLSNMALADQLRLDPTSLTYYQQLLAKMD